MRGQPGLSTRAASCAGQVLKIQACCHDFQSLKMQFSYRYSDFQNQTKGYQQTMPQELTIGAR